MALQPVPRGRYRVSWAGRRRRRSRRSRNGIPDVGIVARWTALGVLVFVPLAIALSLYAQGATAATMIQENWDESVQTDVVHLLQKLIPRGVWMHDRQDGNGDAHLKSGLVGPSETVPIIENELGLSTWQNIFFCEFDGPRKERNVVCTVIANE